MVDVNIDGENISVEEGTTILEAAKKLGINIPTLCYLKEFGPTSCCRICLVDIVNGKGLAPACSFAVAQGMIISTNSEKVKNARKLNLELLLSNHNYDCIHCSKDKKCELQKLVIEYDADENKFKGEKTPSKIDSSGYSIERDNSKCILCKRCVLACNKRQTVHAIGLSKRGFNTHIASPFDLPLNTSPCVNCGQCILACPTGALKEISNVDLVKKILKDKKKIKVAAIAPSVRVTMGEEFGLGYGSNIEPQIVTGLKKLGFDLVFDVDFSADLTIVEEANEFVSRVVNGGKLPMFTSCCPGWIEFVKKYYPEFTDNLSSCKSPQQMFGAILKSYYAEKTGIDPKDIIMVSVMPCTAKKSEINLFDMDSSGYKDIDVSITVRELGKIARDSGIDFTKLNGSNFDRLMGDSTGAGVIFGASGGVMEAALRTATDIITGEDLKEINYKTIRGMKGIKEAKLNIAGKTVKIAVASGLSNARKLLDAIKANKAYYDFIEIMACPGGCINGGGTPFVESDDQNFVDYKLARASYLYSDDQNKQIRKSHKNPEIIELYKWLGKPNGKKAHKYLHRHYK